MILRLAIGGPEDSIRHSLSFVKDMPAALLSFAYWSKYDGLRSHHVRDIAVDSGAFTAHASGTHIDLGEYTAFARRRLKDPRVVEIFALDVIGDAATTIKNTDALWRNGIPVIPTYHYGQPVSALDEIAERFPKIALGGAAKLHTKIKLKWADACFRRVYPKAIHGFGFGAKEILFALPFHSVDASSWSFAPRAMGRWAAFATHGAYAYLGCRGKYSMRAEIEHYLELERLVSHCWREETPILDRLSRDYTNALEGARKRNNA
jgi:hypothetical protein